MYQEVFQRIPGIQCLKFYLVPRYVFSKCYREDSRASALRADEAFMMELEKIKVGDIFLGLEKLEIALDFFVYLFWVWEWHLCIYIYTYLYVYIYINM